MFELWVEETYSEVTIHINKLVYFDMYILLTVMCPKRCVCETTGLNIQHVTGTFEI
jgi:hypothetical protein